MVRLETEEIIVGGLIVFPCHFMPEPEAYYVLEDEVWVRYSEKNFKLRLKQMGLNHRVAGRADLSEVDQALHAVQTQRKIDFAIPLAGWPAGLYRGGGRKILVTESTIPLPAKEGSFEHVERYLKGLLGDGYKHQIGWWKWRRQNQRGDKQLPAQIMIYVGKSGTGKSLLQKITTRLLGGKDCCPFQYMTGDSSFNSELFEAGHLVIEDKFSSSGLHERRAFGAKMKELAVCAVQRCHPKNKVAITLSPRWAVSCSLNSEFENLSMLPPMDESMLDKVMLFKCGQPEFPCDLESEKGWSMWDSIMDREIPALAHFIDNFDMNGLSAQRYGVKPWHDPELLNQESETSPESMLYEIIRNDLPLVYGNEPKWEGSAMDLERVLTGSEMTSRDIARKLFKWNGACGTYLGRLCKKSDKVSKRIISGQNRWIIDLAGLRAEAATLNNS